MKDNFSTQSDKYAKYRPSYPKELFDYLNIIVSNKDNAWDCGTGNGQIASILSKTYNNIYATDISQSQIDNAQKTDNILYSVQAAEKTNFNENFFNLIVVAQAIHWFNFDQFYAEVIRTAKKDALLAVIGYGRLRISKEIDHLISNFYINILGKYWDKERKYIDEDYKTIPFPFDEIESPKFENIQQWSLDHLIGYLNTWSAVKHFIKQNNYNPIEQLQTEIEKVWGNDTTKAIHFPILIRIGKIKK
ncbi:class I SAM-dependent methyltransferase [Empedobacter tilapiae]|uniref:Class I SAM-dependent methyltransferase n=1 Tax=Empedobacter tilapiae TaxID=2491114 RepID=A0A4Z1BIV1_9FLAO|nr:class I SAM-dependent methyltransferase [Empedobacter tilapiae]TGN29394.1 class I SAM-dependent methyltransferase [Empedobacter tilapiae]